MTIKQQEESKSITLSNQVLSESQEEPVTVLGPTIDLDVHDIWDFASLLFDSLLDQL